MCRGAGKRGGGRIKTLTEMAKKFKSGLEEENRGHRKGGPKDYEFIVVKGEG